MCDTVLLWRSSMMLWIDFALLLTSDYHPNITLYFDQGQRSTKGKRCMNINFCEYEQIDAHGLMQIILLIKRWKQSKYSGLNLNSCCFVRQVPVFFLSSKCCHMHSFSAHVRSLQLKMTCFSTFSCKLFLNRLTCNSVYDITTGLTVQLHWIKLQIQL